ncbi:helix-turn-helix domain-containing protein [Hyphomicrobium facile]|uniref:Cupin domain-containing protein n=1 Tax=Hyphomicrobium facile TaxID=51670 RepID=A0A1I7MW53_9HYPH|nr:XRE family transcriptional regulator [Hyphomicrobium facile]SFV26630.1 Cupin domain-containing protein [Hyphomicrobium facile]
MARKEDFETLEGADSGPAKLSIIVGENLRHLRRKNGLSLEQLGVISGVSRAMLGQIETGKSAPTINLLGRIAEALKVSVPSLISSPGVGGTVVVPRDRATVVSSSEGGFVSRALFPWGDPQRIEIYEVTIGAQHRELFAAQTAGAKKNLVVVKGTVEIVVGEDSPARLIEGDAILFNADTPHHFHNPGDEDAKAFLVVTGLDGSNSRGRQG